MSLMCIREYGRHRHVSHVAVLKALRTGRIRQKADGFIDSDQADRDWASNTHPAPRAPRAAPAAVAADPGFARARTVRLHFEALTAKHEYERRISELVDAGEVRIASRRIAQIFREYLLRIPDTAIARFGEYIREHAVAPGEHVIHAILVTEIRAALECFCYEMIGDGSQK
jgi:hypothetical protein